MICNLCPRHCGVERPHGYCGMGERALVVRTALHHWEEPCISGERGSGTVFFAGCPLGCVYCQNRVVSCHGAASGRYREVDAQSLRELCTALIHRGAHNINFVTPTHYAHVVSDAVGGGFSVPVVYNTGGYESVDALRSLCGKVQVYLPDMKYALSEPAQRYSAAPDYPEVAAAAIREMVRQTGPYRLDEDGMLQSGVLIRHLVLPGQAENTRRVIEWVNDNFRRGEVLFSLMGQYTPIPGIEQSYPELAAPLSPEEYAQACAWVEEADRIEGYCQELSSADACYIPEWGVFGG